MSKLTASRAVRSSSTLVWTVEYVTVEAERNGRTLHRLPCLIKTLSQLVTFLSSPPSSKKNIVVKLYTSKMLHWQNIPLGWSAVRSFFPLIQDAEHNIYILQKGTRRRAICVSNGERAAEGILDLDEELEM